MMDLLSDLDTEAYYPTGMLKISSHWQAIRHHGTVATLQYSLRTYPKIHFLIEKLVSDGANSFSIELFQEWIIELVCSEKVFKSGSQFRKLWAVMVMACVKPSGFPDMLLWIQIRWSRRIFHDLQSRIAFQELFDRLAAMPFGPVPKQENWFLWIGCQNLLKVLGCGFRIHLFRFGDDLLTGDEIERAVEVDLVPLWMCSDDGCLSHWRPNRCGRCLKIHACFIFGQIDSIWMLLSIINQFFSTISSNSATFISERERNILAVRW